MFIPNNWAEIREATGYAMRSGEPTFGPAQRVRCAIVRLQPKAQKTSVRADSSASRGSSDEIAGDAVLLFSPDHEPKIDNVVVVEGVELRVVGCEPRRAVTGKLDHYQATLKYWDGL